MKSTKISPDIQRALNEALARYPGVREIVKDIAAFGGHAYLVGGAVRDVIMGLPLKDLDIEVHDMPLDALEALLKRYGNVSLIGKSFGVLRLHGADIDWSLPRSDSSGRKPEVVIDPKMSLKDATARRDLSMNTMAIDLTDYQLFDHFDAQQDIESKTLRSPNPEFFAEDPLRLFRVMQFISRFDMYPDEQLNTLCKQMDISKVSRERIEEEFKKLLLKSERPSLGIRWLKDMGRLKEILPELAATIGVEQNPEWHPEGDVFEHTMQALDAAAQLEYETPEEKLVIMYAALCHDLGKVTTTKRDEEGKIISHDHAQEGLPLTKSLLKRITEQKDILESVEKLVHYHLMPLEFYESNPHDAAYKRLARKLAPDVSMAMLAKLALADRRGRNEKSHEPLTQDFEAITKFIERTKQLEVHEGVEKPALLGRDIKDIIEPGPEMGTFLQRAYEIQLEEGIKDKDELKKRVLEEKKE